jgi:hypothetical protein
VKDTLHDGETAVAARREHSRRLRKRTMPRCSICMRHTWFDTIHLVEPPGVPEPRRSWIVCKRCHADLLIEMRRSPIRTPLRLRIAMGLVAAERSPLSRSRSRVVMSDRAWVLVIGWGFAIAMLLHLVLIVMLAFVAR